MPIVQLRGYLNGTQGITAYDVVWLAVMVAGALVGSFRAFSIDAVRTSDLHGGVELIACQSWYFSWGALAARRVICVWLRVRFQAWVVACRMDVREGCCDIARMSSHTPCVVFLCA